MSSPKHWAVVPAAGVGRRMGAAIPKQYLALAGSTVLDQTLGHLLAHGAIDRIYLALSQDDDWWKESHYADDPRIIRTEGGAERCHSVLNALERVSDDADPRDWVLVHDAARPCLRLADLDRLIANLEESPSGGLLGMPVRDTMKRTDRQNRVTETVERDHLWHAFTPQMFRLGLLRQALRDALDRKLLVTDEASAMELAGYTPLLVAGHADNIKITRSEDLGLAAFYLQQQEQQ